jgi:type III secretion protein R
LADAAAREEGVRVKDDLLGKPIVLVIALAVVSLLPFIFMSLTAFVKISTVLQITRSAIGAQSVPSNTVVMALATALTLIAMAPVGEKISARLMPVFDRSELPDSTTLVKEGFAAIRDPLRDFLKANASEREKDRFYQVARNAHADPAEKEKVGKDDFAVLVPAFVVTELTEAFALGFLIFLPFLIIDLVVSNVLLALGMQMLSPTQISLPFKLLLFVATDGWGLLAQSLVAGY